MQTPWLINGAFNCYRFLSAEHARHLTTIDGDSPGWITVNGRQVPRTFYISSVIWDLLLGISHDWIA